MFFETERRHFFRPLSGKHREVIVACVRALYERLHGPSADYAQNLSRDGLRDLLLPVVREARRLPAPEDDNDGEPALIPEHADDGQGTAAVVRALQRDGWVEAFPDRAGLVTAYRLTRAGKLFAEAIEEISLKQVEAVRATGASFMNVIAFGVLPQVLPRFIGFSTYQFDSNVRNSTMVGIVGAGGIGAPLFVAFQRFDYDAVCAILITIIAVVFASEVISTRIQKIFSA